MDQKNGNFLSAIFLCMIVLLGWQYFVVEPKLAAERARQAELQKLQGGSDGFELRKDADVVAPDANGLGVGALNAQRQMNSTSKALGRSFERLSSGLKVNSSSDDAAGIAVSTGLTAQTKGFSQAMENANEAIALLQTTEGSYNSISDILILHWYFSCQTYY